MSLLPSARPRSTARIRFVAALVAAAALVVPLLAPAMASADVPGDFTVNLDYDGTGHGTADACPIVDAPVDATPTDGVVCTNDRIGYSWDYALATGATPRTITFTQTVPAGVEFDQSNITLLQAGTGYTGTATIVTNPDGSQTLTAVLTFAANQSLSGGLPIVVNVTGDAVNGTIVQADLTVSEDVQAPEVLVPDEVVVRSAPMVDLYKRVDTLGTISHNGVVGYLLHVTNIGLQEGSSNGKGAAALEETFSWSDDIGGMTPNTELGVAGFGYPGCSSGAGLYNTPDAGIGVAPGTLTCTQSAPGADVQLELTGADTSGSAPNGYQFPQYPGHRTLFSEGYNLFVPFTDITPGAAGVDLTDQLTGFDPNDTTGQSNFGDSYEPGGAPDDTCVGTTPGNPSPDNNNCVTTHLVYVAGAGAPTYGPKFILNPDNCYGPSPFYCHYLPGEAGGALQTGLAGPGKALNNIIQFTSPNNGATVEGLVVCDVFDPTQQQYDDTREVEVLRFNSPPYTLEDHSTFKVQYASVATPAGCGLPGDDATEGPWYDDITAAGGPSVVNMVRVIDLTDGVNAPEVFWVSIPTVNIETIIGTHVTDEYWGRWEGRPDGSEGSNTSLLWPNGYNVVNSVVGVSKTVAPAVTTVTAGQTLTFSLVPTLTSSGPGLSDQQVITLVDTLPVCYVDPQPVPATLADWSLTVTPADVGTDGVACTTDDVSGTVLTFVSLLALPTDSVLPAASYTVRVAPNATDGVSTTNTVVASTPSAISAGQQEYTRTDTVTLLVRAASQVMVSKTVDVPVIEIEPDVTGWTVTFANQSDTDAGETQFIDVLPWSGDARGSDFAGRLDLTALSLVGAATSGTLIEYSARASTLIDDDPTAASNGAGGATTWCVAGDFGTPGCPADIAATTAVRMTISAFDIGWLGGFHLAFQPVDNEEGDVYINATGPGDAANLSLAIPPSNPSQTRVVASSIGDRVWYDANADGVQDAGETGFSGVTVRLFDGATEIATTTTGADGLYLFEGYHSDTYRVVVDTSTLPLGYTSPTYDLDGGIATPNSDSGDFALGIDVDRVDVDFGYTRLDPVELTISKQLSGDATDFGESQTFTIEVTCSTDGVAEDGFPQTVTITGTGAEVIEAPVGSTCTVVETDDGGATSTVITPAGGILIDGIDDEVTIEVENVFDAGDLVIRKLLEGPGVESFGDGPFDFDVVCTYEGQTVYDDVVTLSRVAGETSLESDPITDLPIGASCTITETDNGGADDTPPAVIVLIDDSTEATIADLTNWFSAGTVEVEKLVDGELSEWPIAVDFEFEVQVTCQIEDESMVRTTLYSGLVTVLAGETVPVEGPSGPIELPVGAVCFMTETDAGAATGVSITNSTFETGLTVVASDSEALQVLGLLVTNTFDAAHITIDKTVVGPGTAGPYTFEVTCTLEGIEVEIPEEFATFELSHGESITIPVPVGADCTIDEVDVPALAVVTVVDSDDESAAGTIENLEGDDNTVSFTNTFPTTMPNTGSTVNVALLGGGALAFLVGVALVAWTVRRRRGAGHPMAE